MADHSMDGVIFGIKVGSPELERFRHRLPATLGEPVDPDELVVPLLTTGEIGHYDRVRPTSLGRVTGQVDRAIGRAELIGTEIEIVPSSLSAASPYLAIGLKPAPEITAVEQRVAQIVSRRVDGVVTPPRSWQLGILEGHPDEEDVERAQRNRVLPGKVTVTGIVNRLSELAQEPGHDAFIGSDGSAVAMSHELVDAYMPRPRQTHAILAPTRHRHRQLPSQRFA